MQKNQKGPPAMLKWCRTDVPHKGWTLVRVEDVMEGMDGCDESLYETCEMCGKEEIRYVHVLTHPGYEGQIRVGCVCAEKMTDDYVTPRKYEHQVKNRAARWRNFRKQTWYINHKGNLVLHYKGEYITAIVRQSGISFIYDGCWISRYKGRRIEDMEALKAAAFDAFDKRQRE